MQSYEPTAIQNLFLKQIRNLTMHNTVYVTDEESDDIYTETGIDNALETNQLDAREASVMKGYLGC